MTALMYVNLIFWLNMFLSLAVAWACICRLNSDICKVYTRARVRYTALLVGALASAFQTHLFGTYPNAASVLLALSVAVSLLANIPLWQLRPPEPGTYQP